MIDLLFLFAFSVDIAQYYVNKMSTDCEEKRNNHKAKTYEDGASNIQILLLRIFMLELFRECWGQNTIERASKLRETDANTQN